LVEEIERLHVDLWHARPAGSPSDRDEEEGEARAGFSTAEGIGWALRDRIPFFANRKSE